MSQLQYAIISDNVCDYCKKTLSVTPVKVYPNRKIKCGRCSTSNGEEDDGVDSMYNKIASGIFFECINKFDGCTQLLKSTEVVEHEKLCLSKTYVCSICSKEMFTFLIMRHFKLNHPESLLEKPYFQVTDLKNVEKTFLYQLESHLFFVNFRDVSDSFADGLRRFSLRVSLKLKKKGYIKDLKVDFFEQNIDILDKTVYTNGSKSVTYDITLNIAGDSKLLVMLHLNNFKTESVEGKINKIRENNSDLKRFQGIEYLKTLLFQKRNIIPEGKAKSYLSNLTIIEKSTLSYTKSDNTVTITLACYYCSLIYPQLYNVYNNNQCNTFIKLFERNGHYYINCLGCNNIQETDLNNNLFSETELNHIQFFCNCGCGKLFTYKNLYVHEKNCKKQIYQKCPIKWCFHYCKLYELNEHVQNEHSSVICQSIDSYEEMLVNLDPTKSVIEHIMFAWCVSVFAKFKFEHPTWTISLTCEIPDIKIKAVLFNSNETKISTIIESGSIPHESTIYLQVRCLSD